MRDVNNNKRRDSNCKELPSESLKEAFEKLNEVKEKAEKEQEIKTTECPHCGSERVVSNGKQRKKQAYLCRSCRKSFLETATSDSHSSETVVNEIYSLMTQRSGSFNSISTTKSHNLLNV